MPDSDKAVPVKRGRPKKDGPESDYNKRSTLLPIEGPYTELAKEARRILGWTENLDSGMSSRSASNRTGINHMSISQLIKGKRMEEHTLQKFARAMAKAYPERNVNVDRLLFLAGYVPAALQEMMSHMLTRDDELSRFNGIIIRMHGKAGATELAPHFFAYYGGDAVVYCIDPLKQIAGGLSQHEQQITEAWAKLRQKELQHNWQLSQKGEPLEPIAPFA